MANIKTNNNNWNSSNGEFKFQQHRKLAEIR